MTRIGSADARTDDGAVHAVSRTASDTSDPFDVRYGADVDGAGWPRTPTVDLQLRRRSIRRFQDRPVPPKMLASIIAAAQSAATSSNLQTWSAVAIRDPERRTRLAAVSRSLPPGPDGAVVLAFVADWSRARVIASRHEGEDAYSQQFDATLVGVIDAALAAQNAALAAESFGLGTVFIGSLRDRPEIVAAELGLPHGAVALFALLIGWPHSDESAGVKPRLPLDAVLHEEQYREMSSGDVDAYDQRVRTYYAGQGMERGWTDRLLARLARPNYVRSRLGDAFARLGLAASDHGLDCRAAEPQAPVPDGSDRTRVESRTR